MALGDSAAASSGNQFRSKRAKTIVPHQSWWGSAYCEFDLGCGHSGFKWEIDSSDEDDVIDTQATKV